MIISYTLLPRMTLKISYCKCVRMYSHPPPPPPPPHYHHHQVYCSYSTLGWITSVLDLFSQYNKPRAHSGHTNTIIIQEVTCQLQHYEISQGYFTRNQMVTFEVLPCLQYVSGDEPTSTTYCSLASSLASCCSCVLVLHMTE